MSTDINNMMAPLMMKTNTFVTHPPCFCRWFTAFFLCLQDPASSTGSEADSDAREGEPVTINYKPSPLQMKIGEPELQLLSQSLSHYNVRGLRRYYVTAQENPGSSWFFENVHSYLRSAKKKQKSIVLHLYFKTAI